MYNLIFLLHLKLEQAPSNSEHEFQSLIFFLCVCVWIAIQALLFSVIWDIPQVLFIFKLLKYRTISFYLKFNWSCIRAGIIKFYQQALLTSILKIVSIVPSIELKINAGNLIP